MWMLSASACATLGDRVVIRPTWRDRLDDLEQCVSAILAVTSGLRGGAKDMKTRLHRFVHDTEDGLIVSEATRVGRKWFAHHWGSELDGGTHTKTLREAIAYLIASFRQMFPEHSQCTERCETEEIGKWGGKT